MPRLTSRGTVPRPTPGVRTRHPSFWGYNPVKDDRSDFIQSRPLYGDTVVVSPDSLPASHVVSWPLHAPLSAYPRSKSRHSHEHVCNGGFPSTGVVLRSRAWATDCSQPYHQPWAHDGSTWVGGHVSDRGFGIRISEFGISHANTHNL